MLQSLATILLYNQNELFHKIARSTNGKMFNIDIYPMY